VFSWLSVTPPTKGRGAERINRMIAVIFNEEVSMGAPVVDTFKIINEHSRLVLEVEGEATTEGTLIEQYTDTGKKHQWWQLELVEPAGPDDEVFYNVKNVNSGMSLEVVGDSKESGADIVQRSYGDGPFNRQWELITVDGKVDVYKIRSRSSNLFLDDENGNKNAPAPVKQYAAYNADARQQWKLIRAGATIHEQTSQRQVLSARAEDAQGHALTLSAKLKVTVRRASDNQPVAGLPIRFNFSKTGGDLGTAVTNTEGIAECDSGTQIDLIRDAACLAFGYDAVFDGDAEYAPFVTHARILFGII
jgi:hypothetical protein